MRTTAPDTNPAMLEAAARLMARPDPTLAWLATTGATVVGPQPLYGVFRHTEGHGIPSNIPMHTFEGAFSWNSHICSLPAPPKRIAPTGDGQIQALSWRMDRNVSTGWAGPDTLSTPHSNHVSYSPVSHFSARELQDRLRTVAFAALCPRR